MRYIVIIFLCVFSLVVNAGPFTTRGLIYAIKDSDPQLRVPAVAYILGVMDSGTNRLFCPPKTIEQSVLAVIIISAVVTQDNLNSKTAADDIIKTAQIVYPCK